MCTKCQKKPSNPEIAGKATGAALSANVTLGNDFQARIRCLDMKLLAPRLPRHSWSELAARRPPGEPDAVLGRARAVVALQCKTLYHSSEIAEISEISPSSPRPPELSFENWEASDGKNESSRRVLFKSGEFVSREVEVTRAE